MRLARPLLLAAAVATQLVSCGPDLAGPEDSEEIQVPPPSEIISFDPAVDLGEVMPSGVDPAGSRPPPPPFDR